MLSPVEFTHDTIVSIRFQLAQLPPRRNPLIIITQAPLQTSIGYFSQSSPSLLPKIQQIKFNYLLILCSQDLL